LKVEVILVIGLFGVGYRERDVREDRKFGEGISS
jgi:hypothetical protein